MLPLGKLPPDQLARLLSGFARADASVLLGPGVGLDCAVLDIGGDQLLVAKSDPITFATDEIGWYAVHVNANDVATTGATPRWFLSTVLLPQNAPPDLIDRIFEQIRSAADEIGATIVGGHTEVTHDLARPIVVGTLLGLVERSRLILPTGVQPGNAIILTKQIAVEATALVAREKAGELAGSFDVTYLNHCRNFLRDPGISVVRDAQIAVRAGRVHAMHDPTEGGLATALNELAIASHVELIVDAAAVSIYPETQRLCEFYRLDPWGVIASGSLLIAAEAADADQIVQALESNRIEAAVIGQATARSERPVVWLKRGDELHPLPTFPRDEIARWFE